MVVNGRILVPAPANMLTRHGIAGGTKPIAVGHRVFAGNPQRNG